MTVDETRDVSVFVAVTMEELVGGGRFCSDNDPCNGSGGGCAFLMGEGTLAISARVLSKPTSSTPPTRTRTKIVS